MNENRRNRYSVCERYKGMDKVIEEIVANTLHFAKDNDFVSIRVIDLNSNITYMRPRMLGTFKAKQLFDEDKDNIIDVDKLLYFDIIYRANRENEFIPSEQELLYSESTQTKEENN